MFDQWCRVFKTPYDPPELEKRDIVFLGWFLGIVGVVRGVDHLLFFPSGHVFITDSLMVPWAFIGCTTILGGALLLLGLWFKRHFVIYVAHIISFLALFIVLLASVVEFFYPEMLVFYGNGDLNRTGLLLYPTVMHPLAFLRMGVSNFDHDSYRGGGEE